jgi:hypothetical protein
MQDWSSVEGRFLRFATNAAPDGLIDRLLIDTNVMVGLDDRDVADHRPAQELELKC